MWIQTRVRDHLHSGCACQVSQGLDGKPKLDPEAVTKKWGLEAGLFNIFTSKEEAGQTGQSKGQQVGQ